MRRPDFFVGHHGAGSLVLLVVLVFTLLGEPVAAREGYGRLEEALERYRRVAGRDEPEPVPPGPALKLGAKGERVVALRERLAAVAEAEGAGPLLDPELPETFDFSLEMAVRDFQERHGLEPDGVAGASTLAEVNRTAEEQIRKLEVNLERWRRLPPDFGERHILVNIPAFRLDAMEDGRSVLDMKVIVGRNDTRTPVVSSAIEDVVLNPSWYVPKSIASKSSGRKAGPISGAMASRSCRTASSARSPGRTTPLARPSSGSPTVSASTSTTPRPGRCSTARSALSATAASGSRGPRTWPPGSCAKLRSGAKKRFRTRSTRAARGGRISPSPSPSTSSTGPPGSTTPARSASVRTSTTRTAMSLFRRRYGRRGGESRSIAMRMASSTAKNDRSAVETPQSVTTDLPGVNRRGVSHRGSVNHRRSILPRRRAWGFLSRFGWGLLVALLVACWWPVGGVAGGLLVACWWRPWWLGQETPRRCTPGRIVVTDWGVSTPICRCADAPMRRYAIRRDAETPRHRL